MIPVRPSLLPEGPDRGQMRHEKRGEVGLLK